MNNNVTPEVIPCNQIVKHSEVDNMLYDVYTDNNVDIDNVEKHKKNPTKDAAVRDIYNGLFKLKVETNEPTNKFQECLRNLLNTPEFEQLRIQTSLDVGSSMLGTVSIGNNFFDSLPEEVVEEEKLRQEIQNLQEAAQKVGPNKQQKMQQLIQGKQDKMDQLHKSNANVNTGGRQNIIQNATNIVKVHKEFKESLGDTFGKSFGTEEGKREVITDISDRIHNYEKLSNSSMMKKIAKNIGDMEVILDSWNRKKINKIPDEVVNVECGNNLRNILPGQKSLLVMPETEMYFYKKYVDRALLQYKRKGIEHSGNGPIFYVEDVSGSMQGEQTAWSRAIGFTLMKIAKAERRKFYLIQFNTGTTFESYDYADITEKVILDYLSTTSDGGTDYNRVLQEIHDVILDVKTDVIFTTDGEFNNVDHEIVEKIKTKKQQYEFNVYGILVGQNNPGEMTTFCNKIHRLGGDNLMNEDILEDIFSI